MRAIRTLALGVLAALSVAALPTASQAYTAEEQAACQPDAFRLCGSEIPDIERVKVCMIARRAQLSPECRRFFQDPEPIAAPAAPVGQPVNIRPASAKPVAAKKAKAKNTEAKADAKKPGPKKPEK
jgi:hypothetical protein